MLKRLEVYVDAALLSFAFALCAFLALAMGFARLLVGLVGTGVGGALGMVGPAAVVGAALAIWVSRVLHRRTTAEPMTREESAQVAWIALATAVAAPLLWTAYTAVGATSPAVWMAVAVLLLVLAVALAVDAVADLIRVREYLTLDVIRVLLVGLLGLSLVMSLIQPAQPGTDQDVSLYVVGITVYMLVVALLAFVWDEMVSWRKRSHTTQAPLSPSV